MAQKALSVFLAFVLVVLSPGLEAYRAFAESEVRTRINERTGEQEQILVDIPTAPKSADNLLRKLDTLESDPRLRTLPKKQVDDARTLLRGLRRHIDEGSGDDAEEARKALEEISRDLDNGNRPPEITLASIFDRLSHFSRRVEDGATTVNVSRDATGAQVAEVRAHGRTQYFQRSVDLGLFRHREEIRRPDPNGGGRVLDALILKTEQSRAHSKQEIAYNRKLLLMMENIYKYYYMQPSFKLKIDDPSRDPELTAEDRRKLKEIWDDKRRVFRGELTPDEREKGIVGAPLIIEYLNKMGVLDSQGNLLKGEALAQGMQKRLAELSAMGTEDLAKEAEFLKRVQNEAMVFYNHNQVETLKKGAILQITSYLGVALNAEPKQKKDDKREAHHKGVDELEEMIKSFEQGDMGGYTTFLSVIDTPKVKPDDPAWLDVIPDILTLASEAYAYVAYAARAQTRLLKPELSQEEKDATLEEAQHYSRLAQGTMQVLELKTLAYGLNKLVNGDLMGDVGLDDKLRGMGLETQAIKLMRMADSHWLPENERAGAKTYVSELEAGRSEAKELLIQQLAAGWYIDYLNASLADLDEATAKERIRVLKAKVEELKTIYLARAFDRVKTNPEFRRASIAKRLGGSMFKEFIDHHLTAAQREAVRRLEDLAGVLNGLTAGTVTLPQARDRLAPLDGEFREILKLLDLGITGIPDSEAVHNRARSLSVRESRLGSAVQDFVGNLRIFDMASQLDLAVRANASEEQVNSKSEGLGKKILKLKWMDAAFSWITGGFAGYSLRDKAIDYGMEKYLRHKNPKAWEALGDKANQARRENIMRLLGAGDFKRAMEEIEKLDPDAAQRAQEEYEADKAEEDPFDVMDLDAFLTKSSDNVSLVRAQGVVVQLFKYLKDYIMSYMIASTAVDTVITTLLTLGLGTGARTAAAAARWTVALGNILRTGKIASAYQKSMVFQKILKGMDALGKGAIILRPLGSAIRFIGNTFKAWSLNIKNTLGLKYLGKPLTRQAAKNYVRQMPAMAARALIHNIFLNITLGLATAGMEMVKHAKSPDTSQYKDAKDAFWQGLVGGMAFGAKGALLFAFSPIQLSALGRTGLGRMLRALGNSAGPSSAIVNFTARMVPRWSQRAVAKEGVIQHLSTRSMLQQSLWKSVAFQQLIKLWAMVDGAAKFFAMGQFGMEAAMIAHYNIQKALGGNSGEGGIEAKRWVAAQEFGHSYMMAFWFFVPMSGAANPHQMKKHALAMRGSRRMLKEGMDRGEIIFDSRGRLIWSQGGKPFSGNLAKLMSPGAPGEMVESPRKLNWFQRLFYLGWGSKGKTLKLERNEQTLAILTQMLAKKMPVSLRRAIASLPKEQLGVWNIADLLAGKARESAGPSDPAVAQLMRLFGFAKGIASRGLSKPKGGELKLGDSLYGVLDAHGRIMRFQAEKPKSKQYIEVKLTADGFTLYGVLKGGSIVKLLAEPPKGGEPYVEIHVTRQGVVTLAKTKEGALTGANAAAGKALGEGGEGLSRLELRLDEANLHLGTGLTGKAELGEGQIFITKQLREAVETNFLRDLMLDKAILALILENARDEKSALVLKEGGQEAVFDGARLKKLRDIAHQANLERAPLGWRGAVEYALSFFGRRPELRFWRSIGRGRVFKAMTGQRTESRRDVLQYMNKKHTRKLQKQWEGLSPGEKAGKALEWLKATADRQGKSADLLDPWIKILTDSAKPPAEALKEVLEAVREARKSGPESLSESLKSFEDLITGKRAADEKEYGVGKAVNEIEAALEAGEIVPEKELELAAIAKRLSESNGDLKAVSEAAADLARLFDGVKGEAARKLSAMARSLHKLGPEAVAKQALSRISGLRDALAADRAKVQEWIRGLEEGLGVKGPGEAAIKATLELVQKEVRVGLGAQAKVLEAIEKVLQGRAEAGEPLGQAVEGLRERILESIAKAREEGERSLDRAIAILEREGPATEAIVEVIAEVNLMIEKGAGPHPRTLEAVKSELLSRIDFKAAAQKVEAMAKGLSASDPMAKKLNALAKVLASERPAEEKLASAVKTIGGILRNNKGWSKAKELLEIQSGLASRDGFKELIELFKDRRADAEKKGPAEEVLDTVLERLNEDLDPLESMSWTLARIEEVLADGGARGGLKTRLEELAKTIEGEVSRLREGNRKKALELLEARRQEVEEGIKRESGDALNRLKEDAKALDKVIKTLKDGTFRDPGRRDEAALTLLSDMKRVDRSRGADAGTLRALEQTLKGELSVDALYDLTGQALDRMIGIVSPGLLGRALRGARGLWHRLRTGEKLPPEVTVADSLRTLKRTLQSEIILELANEKIVDDIKAFRSFHRKLPRDKEGKVRVAELSDSAKEELKTRQAEFDARKRFFQDALERAVFGKLFEARTEASGEKVWMIPEAYQFRDASGNMVREFRQGQIDALNGTIQKLAEGRLMIYDLLESSGGKTLLGFVFLGIMNAWATAHGRMGALYVTSNEDLVAQARDNYLAFFKGREPPFEIITTSELMLRQTMSDAEGEPGPFETHEVFMDEMDQLGLETALSLGEYSGQMSFTAFDPMLLRLAKAVDTVMAERKPGETAATKFEELTALLKAKGVPEYKLQRLGENEFETLVKDYPDFAAALKAYKLEVFESTGKIYDIIASGKLLKKNPSDPLHAETQKVFLEGCKEQNLDPTLAYAQMKEEYVQAFGNWWRLGVLEGNYGGLEGWVGKVIDGAFIAKSYGEEISKVYMRDPSGKGIIQFHNDMAHPSLDTFYRTALELRERVPVTLDFENAAQVNFRQLMEAARDAEALVVGASGTLPDKMKPFITKGLGMEIVGRGNDPFKMYAAPMKIHKAGERQQDTFLNAISHYRSSGRKHVLYAWVESLAKKGDLVDRLQDMGVEYSVLTEPGQAYFIGERYMMQYKLDKNIPAFGKGDVEVVLLVGQSGLRGLEAPIMQRYGGADIVMYVMDSHVLPEAQLSQVMERIGRGRVPKDSITEHYLLDEAGAIMNNRSYLEKMGEIIEKAGAPGAFEKVVRELNAEAAELIRALQAEKGPALAKSLRDFSGGELTERLIRDAIREDPRMPRMRELYKDLMIMRRLREVVGEEALAKAGKNPNALKRLLGEPKVMEILVREMRRSGEAEALRGSGAVDEEAQAQ